MLHKITDNVRINGNDNYLKSRVVTLLFLVALGFSLWGGRLAFADSAGANAGDDIEWIFDLRAGNTKLRYWAKTTDGSAVAGTDYEKIEGWAEMTIGSSKIKVSTKTYENADATKTLHFSLSLDNPQWYDGSQWHNVTPQDRLPMTLSAGGDIYY